LSFMHHMLTLLTSMSSANVANPACAKGKPGL
jgi:hypothetical protein